MTEAWTEIWSFGRGAARTYCGVARTQEGYAVDIFHNYTCLETTVHASRDAAHEQARRARARYRTVGASSRKARALCRELKYASWPVMASCAPQPRRVARTARAY